MASIKYCKQRCTEETKWNLKKSTKLTVKTFICINKTKAFKETDAFPDQGKKSLKRHRKRLHVIRSIKGGVIKYTKREKQHI